MKSYRIPIVIGLGAWFMLSAFSAQAQVTNGVAWLWADQPDSTDPYVPNPVYQFNSSGGVNEVARVDTGRYEVVFKGVSANGTYGGIVHARATKVGAQCAVSSMVPDTPIVGDMQVGIACFNTPSNPPNVHTDAPFVALYYLEARSGLPREEAYYFHSETDSSLSYQFNGMGSHITLQRIRSHAGRQYEVNLPGILSQDAIVMVTPFSNDGSFCVANSWLPKDAGTEVSIECLDSGRNQVDTSFLMSYVRTASLGRDAGDPILHGAYVVADQPSADTYTPDVQRNSKGSPITVYRTAFGKYRVNIAQQKPVDKSIALATSYGGYHFCSVTGWSEDGAGGTDVNVDCFSSAGNTASTPEDGRFTLLYLTSEETGLLTDIEDASSAEVPTAFTLSGNYPNPFNPQTTIRFSVPEPSPVRLVVYEVLGRQVRVLVDGVRDAGMHEVVFEARDLSSGTYLYRLETPEGSFTKTMQLVK